jgi:hypothetical protein
MSRTATVYFGDDTEENARVAQHARSPTSQLSSLHGDAEEFRFLGKTLEVPEPEAFKAQSRAR